MTSACRHRDSEPGHLLQLFWIASALHCNLGGGALDLAEIVVCQFDIDCSEIFFETMQLCRARDWNDPGFLGEQPSQRDLSRCRLPLVRDLLKQIHQRLIRLPVLRVKPRDTVAEIGVIERRILVDFACEETLSQRAKWNEADSKFFKSRAGKTSFSGSGYQSEYSLWTAVTG